MAKSVNGVVSGSSDGTVVVVEAGQNILLDVTSPDLVVFSQDGSDLIITSIADGSKIELEGFFSQAGSELPPQLTLSDGSVITAADVTGLVETFDPGAVAPAAGGGAGGAGGGASFSAYEDGGIGEGIGIDGLLDPTALGFPADAPVEFLVALPGQPQFLLNEIGLGTDLFGSGQEKREGLSDLEQQMAELGNGAVNAFLEAASGEEVDFLELRNNTGSDQSTGGNGPSTVGEGVTTISLIGPEGEPVSFDLPNVTVPSGGHLLILQADPSDEAGSDVSTLYLVFNADGDIVGGGPLDASGDWPLGNDTTEPVGVLVTWSLGGDVGQVDTFLANGAEFEPLTLNDNWAGVPEETAALDIFGDSATFNGQISTQEEVSDPIFDNYAPVTLDDLVAAGPLGEDFFHDISANNIFARVDNHDSDTAGDWTTGATPTAGSVNNSIGPVFDGAINVDKDPTNSSQETAQNLDAVFGVAVDPNVANSGTAGHVSVSGEGTGSFDWYSFTVLADGTRVVLDIDEGAGGGAGNGDTELFLYDADGNLVDQNDDHGWDAGSSTGLDSQIGTVLPAGVYYVAVGEFPSSDSSGPFNPGGNMLDPGTTYTLHISQDLGIIDPNPQDPYNDDMNPGQPTGPEATADEELDNNGQNIIIVGENEGEFLNTVTGAIEGGRAQDFLVGGEGNDILAGGAHNDYLEGGSGNDILEGNSGGDVLIDDQGMDILIGGSGTDVIFGRRGAGEEEERGNDFSRFLPDGPEGTEIGNEAGATEHGTGDLLIGDDLYFSGGYGNDQGPPMGPGDFMYGGFGNDQAFGDPQDYMRDIIVAGDGDDVIFGDNAHIPEYYLQGGPGLIFLNLDIWYEAYNNPYDFVDGMRSEVEFYYGGADLIYGGWGNDVIFGQGGDDLILAGHGEDVVAGGSGNDIMRGNDGDDSMFGGFGNDTMHGDADDDFMEGNEDDDIMYGGTGYDDMYGGSGEDLMYGGNQADDMFGNYQDDTMFGGSGNDLMDGGSGNDLMFGDSGQGGAVGDNDIMYGRNQDDTMFGEGGHDRMYGGNNDDDMFGGDGNDQMYGGNGRDLIKGDAGNDRLFGGEGNDTVWGGSNNNGNDGPNSSGDDYADLGGGNDRFDDNFLNSGSDTVYGGSGNDKIWTGDEADTLDGGSGRDSLYGENGDDYMDGGSDNDLMKGGRGADDMFGDSGSDRMFGNDQNDFMMGEAGNDFMDGGKHDDTMSGGAGNDDVNGGKGNDTLRWTMADNTPGTFDDYDGGDDSDTLELYFTDAEFAANEEAIALFANTVEATGAGTLTIGGRTLTATNMEFVAVHTDDGTGPVEIPVLIDDLITTDEDTDVTQTITSTPATLGQDFIPNAQTTTFDTPGDVVLTLPLIGAAPLTFASADWVQVGDVWTMTLTDGDDEYGSLVFNANDPEAVTVTLDIPQEDYSPWDPLDDGDVATAVFRYSASVEGSESAEVKININGANDEPVAADDIVITNVLEGGILIPKSALLANDEDIDEGDELTIEGVTDPSDIFDDDFILNLPGDNRITNGSFEDLDGADLNRGHGSSWATYDSLPGWMVDLGEANAPIELQFGGTGGIGAQDGNTKMELDSHREGTNDEGAAYTSSISHVYQDVSTTAGEMLTVSFWYSPRSTRGNATNEVTVVWDGEVIATLDGNVRGWQQFSFEVEANGDEEVTRLEFQGSEGSSTVGGYIDNVYVGERDFDYTVSDGDATDDAHVDVQYQSGSELVGSDESEILISGEGSDALYGNGGDDTLIGGEGEDEYFFSDAGTDGDDLILGFNEDEDAINLDALFDELGIASDERAELVEIDDGTITIDHAGAADFSITVSGADLGDTGVNYTSDELVLKGIIVSDES